MSVIDQEWDLRATNVYFGIFESLYIQNCCSGIYHLVRTLCTARFAPIDGWVKDMESAMVLWKGVL